MVTQFDIGDNEVAQYKRPGKSLAFYIPYHTKAYRALPHQAVPRLATHYQILPLPHKRVSLFMATVTEGF